MEGQLKVQSGLHKRQLHHVTWMTMMTTCVPFLDHVSAPIKCSISLSFGFLQISNTPNRRVPPIVPHPNTPPIAPRRAWPIAVSHPRSRSWRPTSLRQTGRLDGRFRPHQVRSARPWIPGGARKTNVRHGNPAPWCFSCGALGWSCSEREARAGPDKCF